MNIHKNRAKIIICILLTLLILFVLGFVNPLRTARYKIVDPDVPKEFDGFKIVQLTDFHCKEFGFAEQRLIDEIAKCEPNIICLTGDIIDEEHSLANAELLLKGITEIASVYYVTGNHEFYPGAPYADFINVCENYGVHTLNSQTEEISINNSSIKISGLNYQSASKDMVNHLSYADTSFFNILLYHDSTKFDFISAYDYNLVLAGHVHGGIIRIPLLGGLLGNDGAIFPKYDYGRFDKRNSTMISSSGLGDARVPRWNNPREIVEITLYSGK